VDSRFLKFWGEFLLKAAEGHRHLDEMTRWMQSAFPPPGEMAALFRKCYGLPDSATAESNKLWRQTMADFRNLLEAYAPLWGWIPLERYDQLKRKTKRLETTVAEQARFIEQLEALLEDRNLGHMSMVTRFQNVIDDQNRAFEKLMQSLAPSSGTPDETDP
jgi:uncharacterized coiled-coil protein SlyX